MRDDLIVSRYLTYKKFKDLLLRSATWFSRLSILADQEEGLLPEKSRIANINRCNQWAAQCNDRSFSDAITNMPIQTDRNIKQNMLVNCWHLGEAELPRMWKEYVKDCDGVLLMSTTGQLREVFELASIGNLTCRIDAVRYIHFQEEGVDPIRWQDPFSRVFLKDRDQFSYEKEVRVALHSMACLPDDLREKGALVRTNVAGLINKVLLKPGSSEKFKNAVQILMRKKKLLVPLEMSSLEY